MNSHAASLLVNRDGHNRVASFFRPRLEVVCDGDIAVGG